MKKTYYLLIGIAILCLQLNLPAQSIIRGPYLQSGTPNSMVIKWRTNSSTSSQVWYGTSPSNLAFTKTVNGSRTDHEVLVNGLSANSTYYYAVGNTAGQLSVPGSDYYFRTSPNPGSVQPIRAWILGDAGKANNTQREVRDAFYDFNGSNHIDMILLLGDNAYESGTDAEYQAAMFENMYEGRLINSVVWPAFGNHDGLSALSSTQTGPYYEIFTNPTNAEAGGVPSGTEAYYSFDYGNIHVIVLDSDDSDREPGSPQMNWLEADLAATTQDWKVVTFHHPPYTQDASDSNNKETDMRSMVLPILEAYNVDLVLAGHDHVWERSYLIHGHYGVSNTWDPVTMGINLGDGRLDGDGPYIKEAGNGPSAVGTVYIVAGSAGSAGAITGYHPVMYETLGEKGSMYMEVTGNQMDIKFIRDIGTIDDYLTIIKQSVVGNPPTVSITAPADGASYNAPQTIAISADASDSDGSITQVEFFVNGLPAGVDNQAPYAVNYAIPDDGVYSILAIATDNDGNTVQSGTVQFYVGPVSICSRVDSGSDDAEERSSGSVNLSSSDLELVEDGGQGSQFIGLRFNGLDIPQGASITEAHIQFTADETINVNPANLTITGQASANPATFTSASSNVSSRPRTSASVSWSPADWLAVGDAGSAQQTPDISAIIQEIVNQSDFAAGNSIALIIEGVGTRTAESFDGSTAGAPELCVQYTLESFDCPQLSANIGSPCNDGDNTTINDTVDGNCGCHGTPTACTNIGDADGDGICANVDCNDNDASIAHQPGDACDDGNPGTINDAYDANCECHGTLNDCPGIGDDDGDGICNDVDCNSTDPTAPSLPGDSCDDGDNTTLNDALDANCNCVGTPTACTGIGDADGDGVCFNIDCDDNDPSNTNYVGLACNDGDPTTTGETIQSDCSCGGGVPVPTFTCVRVNAGDDDGEERSSGSVSLSSSDLELVVDGPRGAQVVGMRFAGLNIPQGAAITAAYLQFTADENGNTNPCNLTIFGEAADDAMAFSTFNNNISGRMRTAASVGWIPPDWLTVGEAGAAQQTPDIAPILQEIVNRQGYTSNSAIALMIEGTGARTAEAYEGSAAQAPQLCVAFTTVQYDCQNLQANIGDPCDDGDNTTIDDAVDGNCGCHGTATACTGIGDADGDGVCTGLDCDDNDPTVTSTNANDADCDGVPSNVDCNDNDPTITTTNAGDGDCDGVPTAMDCDDTDASIGSNANDMDCDGVPSNLDCDDNDPTITSVNTGDGDCDGVPTGLDCDDNDPTVTSVNTGDGDCDGVPTGLDCDDNDPTITSTNTNDADCDGVPSNVDCDDNDPTITTTNAGDGDCDGVPTAMDCDDTDASIGSSANDMDCDGVPSNLDCDDNDPTVTSVNTGDGDCDGVPTGTDCDDSDPTVTSANTNDADCDGVPTSLDCDDNDPAVGSNANDMDCDGVPTPIDCDDNDASVTSASTNDADCDGIPTAVDCDDSDPGITTQPGDACNDNNPSTFGETIQSDCTCGGGTSTPAMACAAINAGSDDAEERVTGGRVDLNSSDLELGTDAQSQWLGLRFSNLNIPQGANIVSAYIQFEVDETRNDDPCNLTIYGIAADNSGTFTNVDYDVSSRPRTASTAAWAPAQWLTRGEAGAAQQSPDLSAIVQEIVNRSGYTAASPIAFVIEGTGRRVAESFDGNAGGPALCIEFFDTPPDYDCPSLSAFIGDPCDDGDNTTVNDTVDGDCDCAGTPTACTGIGDGDGDGVCFGADCDDNDPSITTQPGDACDDGNPATVNDVVTANCGCAGTLNDCPGIGDDDGDGICNDVDCNSNDPSVTDRPGDPCDDNDPNTIGETIQADCTCGGGNSTPAQTCAQVSADDDDAEEDAAGSMDMNSSDLELTADPRFGVQTIGMRFNGLNIPQGAVITSAYVQFTVDEAVNDNPCNINIYGQAADNAAMFANTASNISSRPKTSATVSWAPQEWVAVGDAGPAQQTPDLSAVIQEIVDRNGYTSASSIAIIMDGVGRRTTESFNGSTTGAPELCVEYLYATVANRVSSTGDGTFEDTGVEQNAAFAQPAGEGLSSQFISPISVYPNPTNDQLNVFFNSAVDSKVQLQARDLSGKVVVEEARTIQQGNNTITLEGLSLPSGVYFRR
ncbi:MAG: metallophosphoesterase [Lewinellaceae bacterium]|nr:metallophosphoesterase [Lewinellaceae bacterium]